MWDIVLGKCLIQTCDNYMGYCHWQMFELNNFATNWDVVFGKCLAQILGNYLGYYA